MPESLSIIDLGPEDKPLINQQAEGLMKHIESFMKELEKHGCTYFETRRRLMDVRIWNRKPQNIEGVHTPVVE